MKEFNDAYAQVIAQMNTRRITNGLKTMMPKSNLKLRSGEIYNVLGNFYICQFAELNGQEVVVFYLYQDKGGICDVLLATVDFIVNLIDHQGLRNIETSKIPVLNSISKRIRRKQQDSQTRVIPQITVLNQDPELAKSQADKIVGKLKASEVAWVSRQMYDDFTIKVGDDLKITYEYRQDNDWSEKPKGERGWITMTYGIQDYYRVSVSFKR